MSNQRLTYDESDKVFSMYVMLRRIVETHHKHCPCKLCEAKYLLTLDANDDDPCIVYDVLFNTEPIPTDWS